METNLPAIDMRDTISLLASGIHYSSFYLHLFPGSTSKNSSPTRQCLVHFKQSLTNRTAGYGSVRPVVWEGGGREAPSYPDSLSSCGTQWPRGARKCT